MPTSRARLHAALAVAVIVLCLAVLTWFYWPIRGALFQVYAVTAVLLGLRATPPIARWLDGLPGPHRAVLYVVVAAVAAGHFTLSTRTWFPFVAWDIFSSVSDQETIFCHELIGTTESGRHVRLLVEQLFPSIVQFDLPPDHDPEPMNHLVRALVRQYDQLHGADPLREVDLMLMAVKLHPTSGESRAQPSCELLQRFDLSSARSS